MSSEKDEEEEDDPPPVGFHFYADDTPRDPPPSQAFQSMKARQGGFADAESGLHLRAGRSSRSRPLRSGRGALWLAPLAVAIGGVVLLDLTLLHQGRSPKQVVVAALNGIGPQRSAAAPRPLAKAAAETSAPVVPAAPASTPASTPAPSSVSLPAAQPEATPAQPSPLDSCRHPQTQAERMVCRDPELAAEDRQLARVYRAAIAVGAPKGRLALEQTEWLNARDAASRRSRKEVQDLYASRIDDLTHWLDDEHAAQLRDGQDVSPPRP